MAGKRNQLLKHHSSLLGTVQYTATVGIDPHAPDEGGGAAVLCAELRHFVSLCASHFPIKLIRHEIGKPLRQRREACDSARGVAGWTTIAVLA